MSEADQEKADRGPFFPKVARLELDELLEQLVDRARDVMRTQNRLHGLLQATREIASDLSLPALLHTIVSVARDLIGARYAALGVIGRDGQLVQFIHVGMDDETVHKVGHLPTGRGVLGLLITDPRPIRMPELSQHPQAAGFPNAHPPMHSFLGVPIRIRDRVFGNLYLTEKRDAPEFSGEDEELATALAAAAAAAIDNSRLYEAVTRREHWLDASRRITNALLGVVDRREALDRVAEGARLAAGADVVAVLLPSAAGHLTVDAVASERSATGLPTAIDVEASLCGDAFRTGKPLVFDDVTRERAGDALLADGATLGPAMIVPLAAIGAVQGVLVVANGPDGSRFSDEDLEMATDFAGQAALVLNVAAAQAAARRADMLEDRARIARNLHDKVIQRLFITGLGLQALASDDESGEQARQILRHVDELDATIKDIRSTIFALRRDHEDHENSLRAKALDLIEHETAASALSPLVRFDGPLDSLVSTALADDVLAVLREALSNALKYAQATILEVQLAVLDQLSLVVRDDGVGFSSDVERRGLHYMQERAERLGGSCRIESAPGQGTTITWTAPLD
jgi:signal transduction histidine kinase